MKSTVCRPRFVRERSTGFHSGAIVAVLLIVAGCEPGPKTTPAGKASKNSSAAKADSITLPPIDEDSMLVLDGGRLAVRSPAGWTRSPRSKNNLVRYQPGIKETYPAIVVTADDAPEGVDMMDKSGQSKLAAAVAASGDRFTKQPAAIRLGPHPGVTWASPAMAKVDGLSQPIDRESFAVVIGDRLYTIEAMAPKGKLDGKGRAAAIAVASALSVPPAMDPVSEPVGTSSPADEPSEDPPATDAKTDADVQAPATDPAAAKSE